jgi:hypothetical protein
MPVFGEAANASWSGFDEYRTTDARILLRSKISQDRQVGLH